MIYCTFLEGIRTVSASNGKLSRTTNQNGPMRLLITDVRTLKQDTPNVREMEFREASVAIGSHSNSTVQLPDVDIAPHHATISMTGDGDWVYKPTTRDDQTSLNDAPVTQEVMLHDGDTITITHFTIQCRLDAPLGSTAEPSPTVQTGELAKIRQFPLPPRSVVRRSDTEVSLSGTRQRALSDLVASLRDCQNPGHLIERVASVLVSQLEARIVWLGVRMDPRGSLETVFGQTDNGSHSGEPPMLETFSYRCLSRHQFICVPKSETPDVQSILAVPLLVGRAAMGLIYADSRRHVRLFDEADLGYLTVVAGIVAAHLEAIGDHRMDEADASDPETVSLVRDAQARLVDSDLPAWTDLDVAAFARVGDGVVEDVHDVMRLPNGLAAILIAQVKSAPTRALLAMAQIRSAFRIAGLHADRPHVQLKAWNWLIDRDSIPGEAHVAVVVLNPKTGVLECGTAGGIGALIVDKKGKPRKLTDSNAFPLGTRKQAEYKPTSDRLHKGETLALYTSGCATICSASGEELGSRGFLRMLCNSCGQSANATLEEIRVELESYLEDGKAPNDMTIVLAHRSE